MDQQDGDPDLERRLATDSCIVKHFGVGHVFREKRMVGCDGFPPAQGEFAVESGFTSRAVRPVLQNSSETYKSRA